jgi:hypothetical protein
MMGSSGGPITKDNTSVEYYGTIFAVAESTQEEGVIWTGSDDGLVYVSRDDGASWQDVTPPDLPAYAQINSLEAHPTEAGGVYVAATRYKLDDFRPYLYRTTDYGRTWTAITDGIDAAHFTRVVRADPERPGLLYAGTESGMYVSFDDGAAWQPLQKNLPVVPVTDLAVQENDLVVATQGRSFWVLDDLTVLHQLAEAQQNVAARGMHLYRPRPAVRMGGREVREVVTRGQNPPNGAVLRYVLPEAPDSSALALHILRADGSRIKTFRPEGDAGDLTVEGGLPAAPGANQFAWDLRVADAEGFDGLVMWGAGLTGPRVTPGPYQARLVVGEDSMTVPVEVVPDPRTEATRADLEAQFAFLVDVRDKVTETHRAIKRIRTLRAQVRAAQERAAGGPGAEAIRDAADALVADVTAVEEALYQTKNQSRQDPLNYPIRLGNKLAALGATARVGDYRPTQQAYDVKASLTQRIDAHLARLRQVMETDVPAFNALVQEHAVPAISVEMPGAGVGATSRASGE